MCVCMCVSMCVVTNICRRAKPVAAAFTKGLGVQASGDIWRKTCYPNYPNETKSLCFQACSYTPYKPLEKECFWFEKKHREEEETGGINRLLDEKELEKAEREEQDEKKHYLIEVDDEKVADNSGPELDDEGLGKDEKAVEDDIGPELDGKGHGKDLNRDITEQFFAP